MAGILLVSGAVIGGAVFAAAVWKRRVADMLPLSVLFLIAHSWLCGQLGLLRFSAAATVFGMLALGIIGLWLLFKQKPRQPVWDVSLVFFALGVAWVVFVSMGRLPTLPEEYTQWAYTPKAMFFANSLTPEGAQIASPAMAVLQTIVLSCNALLGGGSPDWLFYAAYGMACLALLTPLVRRDTENPWARAGYTLLFFLAAVCVPLQYFDLFSALHPEGFLAILAAMVMLEAAKEKTVFQAVYTGLYLFVLALLGGAGLFFAIAALVLYSVTLLRAPRFRQAGGGRRALLLGMPPALLLLAGLTGRYTLSAHGATAGVWGLYWKTFAAKLVTVRLELTAGGESLISLATAHVSYLALAIALAVCTALLIRAARRAPRPQPGLAALWCAAVCAVVYTVGLLLQYLFVMGEADAAKLLNIQWLLAVGFVPWILVAADHALRMADGARWPWRRHLLVILACACVIGTGSGALDALSRRTFTAANDKYHTYFGIADTAREALPEDARVYIVSQGDDGTGYATLRYALLPRTVNPDATYWLRDPEANQNAWTYPVTAQAWQAEIQAYDDVLVYRSDAYLQTAIAQALTADGVLEANMLYSVNHTTGLLTPLVPEEPVP